MNEKRENNEACSRRSILTGSAALLIGRDCRTPEQCLRRPRTGKLTGAPTAVAVGRARPHGGRHTGLSNYLKNKG